MRILIFGALVFCASFAASRFMNQSCFSSCLFEPSQYTVEDRPFVVAIFGRNNGAYIEKTLSSVFSQRYPNFRVIYLDDHSDDGSFELAKDLIQEKAIVLRNDFPVGKEASFAKAKAYCRQEEILLFLEEEEWLAHEWVLARLNQYYANPDLKVTAALGRTYPDFANTFERGLLSCYASMLHDVNVQDLVEKSDPSHLAYIPETLVIKGEK